MRTIRAQTQLLINQSNHVNNEQKGKGQAPTVFPTITAVSLDLNLPRHCNVPVET
jgi:hypothetical protein